MMFFNKVKVRGIVKEEKRYDWSNSQASMGACFCLVFYLYVSYFVYPFFLVFYLFVSYFVYPSWFAKLVYNNQAALLTGKMNNTDYVFMTYLAASVVLKRYKNEGIFDMGVEHQYFESTSTLGLHHKNPIHGCGP